MRSNRKKTILLLPALVCLAAITLAVCLHDDGALFHRLTDSVTGLFASDKVPAEAPEETPDDAQEPSSEAQDAQDVSDGEEAPLPQDQSAAPPLLNISSSICDPAITELKTQGEQQVLTGGPVEIIYYQQGDERWGDLRYGSDRISTHGCGPTAMAMVVSSMTDTLIDPPSMSQWAVEHGFWARHSGSYHSIVIGTAEAFGLHAVSFPSRNADELREALFSGKLLVALMGPGHFTQNGHFIILRGVTLSGDILVADPASAERSLTAWDAQLILDELSASTADGSPLWLISLPDGTFFE